MTNPVKQPSHYTSHPSGVECIEITKHMGFNLGNAFKYIWRCDLKKDAIEDLEKARQYLDIEIEMRKKAKVAADKKAEIAKRRAEYDRQISLYMTGVSADAWRLYNDPSYDPLTGQTRTSGRPWYGRRRYPY